MSVMQNERWPEIRLDSEPTPAMKAVVKRMAIEDARNDEECDMFLSMLFKEEERP